MNRLHLLWAIVLAVFIASCGGGGDGFSGSSGGTGGTTGGGDDGADTDLGTVLMGSGTAGSFTSGAIAIGAPSLAAGGSTSLTVNFVLDDGAGNQSVFTDPVDVTFSSPCVSANQANLQPAATVQSSGGAATVTYVAQGCSGSDLITARATVSSTDLSATGTVTVAAADIGSIEFVSATPGLIGLKGTGGVGASEQSTVVFRVVDESKGPVSGETVDFSLSTAVGGITLTPATATSDANGQVQTVVQSGTVATTVRVTATIVSENISTQSSLLVVSTGIPDQESVSISVSNLNPEAFNYDGVQVDVTARLSDRFNNPVPDGTAVAFTTEGGKIDSQCSTTTTSTESGVCTVKWTSQNPRPANGRVTILATVIGEESFVDGNSNGVFDSGETFTDLPEAFRDDDEDGIRDGNEFFLDFNNDNNYNFGDTCYNGLLRQGADACFQTTGETLTISGQNTITMSGSEAVIVPNVDPLDVSGGAATVVFTIGDFRGQPMPAGTRIKAETSNGEVVLPSNGEYIVPSTSFDGPINYAFTLTGDGTPDSGPLVITVTTPGPAGLNFDGLETFYAISVID